MLIDTNQEIKNSFNRAAKNYDAHAFIQNTIGRRLLERIDLINCEFHNILDAGCGTGYFCEDLRKRFPKAQVTAIDLAHNMTKIAKSRKSAWLQKKNQFATGDIANQPFIDNAFDMVFCNLAIHWCDIRHTLNEFKRVLKPNGTLLFTLPGPDTLCELSTAFQQLDAFKHVNAFLDMHDVGDQLLAEQYKNAVVDMEKITFEYQSVWALLKDLKMTGVRNIHPERRSHLSTKTQLNHLVSAYEKNEDQQYPLSFEVIYGHGMCPSKKAPQDPNRIPLQVISG